MRFDFAEDRRSSLGDLLLRMEDSAMCSGVEAGGRGPGRQGTSQSLPSDSRPPQDSSARDRSATMPRSSVEVQRFVRHSGQLTGDGSARGSSERWGQTQAGYAPCCLPL